jgi:hypothetical protein
LRPSEPPRRIYRRRSQSELFAPVLLDESADATALPAALALDGDTKPVAAASGQPILTNGDLAPGGVGGGKNLKPGGVSGAAGDADPDKKDGAPKERMSRQKKTELRVVNG